MNLPRPIQRRLWDLERFGWTPRKLLTRLRQPNDAKVLCIALPKAGTHLLERALCLHPDLYRPLVKTINDRNERQLGGIEALLGRLSGGEILLAHLEHQARRVELIARYQVKTLFMIRDPRDVIVSEVFYVMGNRDHPLHGAFARRETMNDRLHLAFLGAPDEGVEPLTTRLDAYAGWFEDADLVIRFEDLIGASGGAEQQHAVLDSIFDQLGVELTQLRCDELVRRLVSRASPTFRRGRVGGWREQFEDASLRTLVEQQLGVGKRAAYVPEGER